jgi:uncharacterized protein Usg
LQKVPPARAKKRQEPGRNRLRSFCNDEHDAEKWAPVFGKHHAPTVERARGRDGASNMISEDFRRQLEGYGLTTARILYRRPDHRWLLQSYVWQDYDLWPEFPLLQKFLAFWQGSLDGPLHSVTVAHARLIRPAEICSLNGELRLH